MHLGGMGKQLWWGQQRQSQISILVDSSAITCAKIDHHIHQVISRQYIHPPLLHHCHPPLHPCYPLPSLPPVPHPLHQQHNQLRSHQTTPQAYPQHPYPQAFRARLQRRALTSIFVGCTICRIAATSSLDQLWMNFAPAPVEDVLHYHQPSYPRQFPHLNQLHVEKI